jgi:CubicO group peptidase (beta-lactamase class C family)
MKCPRSFFWCVFLAASVFLFVKAALGRRDAQLQRERSPALQQAISDASKQFKIPGIAAAVIEHGQIRAVEVFGIRDLKSGAPVTADTLFEAGSLGEPVYAYSVLAFAANGQFNPSAPLPSYLPLPYVRAMDWNATNPDTEKLYDPLLNQITAKRVMNHTSGMPDWAGKQHLQLQLVPGQKWSYSNEGYLYLQQVMEHVSGESFGAFVTRNALGPARMVRSSFIWREADAARAATGYDPAGTPVEIHHYRQPAAASTLITSIRDYAQFVQFLMASAPAQRAHESAVSLMLAPTVTAGGAAPFSWGLGVALEKMGDDFFFVQRGRSPGFASFVIGSRTTGSALVVFTSSANGLDAVPEIIRATIGGNHPILNSSFFRAR